MQFCTHPSCKSVGLCASLTASLDFVTSCRVQMEAEFALSRWCGSVLWIASGRLLETNGQSQAIRKLPMRKVERCRAMLHHITLCTILASKIRSGFQPSCKCEYQAVSRLGNPIASFGLIIIEGSLEVKLLTIWTDEKQRWEESEKRRRRKKIREEKESEERRSRRWESRETLCFSNDLWLRRVEK